MATATDYSAAIGGAPMVPFSSGEGSGVTDVGFSTEMTTPSVPVDNLEQGASQLLTDGGGSTSFSPPIDTLGAVAQDSIGASHEAFDQVPRVYKMKGWSTTLSQYVYWNSVGDALTPPPVAYGTVINITSELLA